MLVCTVLWMFDEAVFQASDRSHWTPASQTLAAISRLLSGVSIGRSLTGDTVHLVTNLDIHGVHISCSLDCLVCLCRLYYMLYFAVFCVCFLVIRRGERVHIMQATGQLSQQSLDKNSPSTPLTESTEEAAFHSFALNRGKKRGLTHFNHF